jgi:hypothetical protein
MHRLVSLLLSLSLLGGAPLALAGGKVQLVGKYKKKAVLEGKKKRSYCVLDPVAPLKLQVEGPAKIVLLVRGVKKETAGFKLDLDSEMAAEIQVEANPRFSKAVYLEVPAGVHRVSAVGTARVLVRPIKVGREAKKTDVLVSWEKIQEAPPPEIVERKVEPEPEPPPKPVLSEKDKSRTVLVGDLRAVGQPEELVRQVTTQIAETLSGAGVTVSTTADIQDRLALEAAQQMMGCQEDSKCMAEVSAYMQSDLLLTGSVGSIGNNMLLNLTLLDVRATRPVGRVSEAVAGMDELAAVLPGALAGLFGWELDQTAPRFLLPEGKKISFAVFDLAPSGVPKEVSDNLAQILSVEIKRIEGASVISRDDMTAMLRLEQDKAFLGCSDDTSCIAEIGGALGVDKLVVGHVGKIKDSYVISLRLIDPREARVDSRITESFRGDEDQLLRAVRHAGRKLLGVGSGAVGKLAVSSSEEEAEVFLDDQKHGELPMAPIADLQVGRHTLRVSKGGYFDFYSDVYVDPHETSAVWAQLSERPARWYQTWWFWTIVGTVVAGAGVTTAILLTRSEPGTGDGTVTFQLMGR